MPLQAPEPQLVAGLMTCAKYASYLTANKQLISRC